MISGFSDVSMTPKTNIIYIWRKQETPNDHETSESLFKNIFGGDLTISTLESSTVMEITWTDENDDPSNTFLKILDMGSISSRNMKCDFGNIGSTSIKQL